MVSQLLAARRWTDGLSVRRRWALAAALGVLAAGALPPIYAVVLLIPAFSGLVWLIAGAPSLRAVLAVGWWFGVGHFAAGLYWVADSFLVEPDKYGWMIPFAIGGLAAGMALFPMVAAGVARLAGGRRGAGPGLVLLLAAGWGISEWLRSWVLTGFPWNLMATVWTFSDAMMQPDAWLGPYAYGLVTVAAAAMPAVLGDDALTPRRGLAWTAAGFAALALLGAGGAARLAGPASPPVPGVVLRLVQPDIPQRLKWKVDLRDRHLIDMVRMSVQPPRGGPPPTDVIWPETAATFFLANDTVRRDFIAQAAPPGGLLITGAPRTTPKPETPYRVWNSLAAVDRQGRVVGTYDKFHLVPFGEYVPLRGLLGPLGISKLTEGRTDFTPGPGPVTLKLPGLPPVSPLICYEIIFPGHVVSPDSRPRWILNITNDSWFGATTGPYQHLAAARLRAVEEGLPVVRVAGTGISAVIDARGRTVESLGLETAGIIDSALPGALAAPPPYARFGEWLLFVTAAIAATAGLALNLRRKSGY